MRCARKTIRTTSGERMSRLDDQIRKSWIDCLWFVLKLAVLIAAAALVFWATANNIQMDNDNSTTAFVRAARTTINESLEIMSQRESEYMDSWAIENLHAPVLTNFMKDHPTPKAGHEKQWIRLIAMASIVDVKLSRLTGRWKHDTGVDFLPYTAAYTNFRKTYDKL